MRVCLCSSLLFFFLNVRIGSNPELFFSFLQAPPPPPRPLLAALPRCVRSNRSRWRSTTRLLLLLWLVISAMITGALRECVCVCMCDTIRGEHLLFSFISFSSLLLHSLFLSLSLSGGSKVFTQLCNDGVHEQG